MNQPFGPFGLLIVIAAITALLLYGWTAELEAPRRPANTGFSGAHA